MTPNEPHEYRILERPIAGHGQWRVALIGPYTSTEAHGPSRRWAENLARDFAHDGAVEMAAVLPVVTQGETP
jgi:hypothetical protein